MLIPQTKAVKNAARTEALRNLGPAGKADAATHRRWILELEAEGRIEFKDGKWHPKS